MTWQTLIDNLPTTIQEWDSAIKESGLHVKWSEQIALIHDMKVEKLPSLEKQRDDYINHPGYYIKIYMDSGHTREEAEGLVEKKKNDFIRKCKRTLSVIELCKKEYAIREKLKSKLPKTPDKYKTDKKLIVEELQDDVSFIERSPIGTTYYLDTDAGNDGNAGTSTGAAWLTLAKYTTTTTLSPGDILICRANTATTAWDGAADLVFDDDGTYDVPIYIQPDWDDAFGDHVDLSVTATATVTAGSRTITFSADVSSVVAANDWIYVSGDNNRDFCYIVETVSTVTVTLRLPYLGDNAGSGKTMINMGSWTIAGTTTATNQAVAIQDYWNISGLHCKNNSTNNGFFDWGVGYPQYHHHLHFELGSTTTGGAYSPSGTTDTVGYFNDITVFNGMFCAVGLSASFYVRNIDVDLNNKAGTAAEVFPVSTRLVGDNIRVRNINGASTRAVQNANQTEMADIRLRNFEGTYTTNGTFVARPNSRASFEDDQNTVSATSYYFADPSTPFIADNTTTVRSGGSNISLEVTPNIYINTFDWSLQTLLDIPIYTDTAARTYSIYFRPDATANWTADPTATELWLELEYWTANDFRRIIKSTGTIDMNGSTTWTALSVTATPGQAGMAYLRVKYGKTKESGKTNVFLIDPIPVIS